MNTGVLESRGRQRDGGAGTPSWVLSARSSMWVVAKRLVRCEFLCGDRNLLPTRSDCDVPGANALASLSGAKSSPSLVGTRDYFSYQFSPAIAKQEANGRRKLL